MKRLVFGLLLVILIAGTVGCGKSSAVPVVITRTMSDSGIPVPAITLAPQPVEQSSSLLGLGKGSSPPTVVVTRTPAPTTVPPGSTSNQGVKFSESQTYGIDRMIIRNGAMQLVVMDVNASLLQITGLANTFGGFVVNSNVQENQSRLYGNISIRVLSSRFGDALAALRAMAVDVRSESTSGQDVTEEYTDLASSLRNLQAAETQLLKLMEQSGKVTDILEVQKELVKTRGEIEQAKGRMQYLEQSSSLAFIQITLEQSKLAVEFTVTARSAKEGQTIYFVPTVSGGFQPYSYAWDFGDKLTSTGERPSHAYKSAGTYAVTLKITDDRGNTANITRDKYVTVLSGWEAGNTASSAWNGFVAFIHFLVNLIIWVGIFSPVWIVVLVILYFTVWRKRKKAK